MNEGFSHNLFQIPRLAAVRDAAAAIIVDEEGRYLMQLRDDKAGIFYPDHWGLFGGAMDDGEDPETALRRELREELAYDVGDIAFFTTMDLGFEALGGGRVLRTYYEVPIRSSSIDRLRLGEGQQMLQLTAADILLERRVVPYDSFAIWLHYARSAKPHDRTN